MKVGIQCKIGVIGCVIDIFSQLHCRLAQIEAGLFTDEIKLTKHESKRARDTLVRLRFTLRAVLFHFTRHQGSDHVKPDRKIGDS